MPFSKTETVDHAGQTPLLTEKKTVDRDAIESWMQPGQATGPWVPLANDCNTWVDNAVKASTPHTVTIPTTPFDGITLPDAVQHADGTIHAGPQTFDPVDPERVPFSQGFVF
jgi:hypothetical protein